MPRSATKGPRIKKQPQRTCVACRETEGKRGLTRIVRTPEGAVELDPSGKRNGRGAYVHASPKCVEALLSGGGLARALKVEVGPDTKNALRSQLMPAPEAEQEEHSAAGFS